MKIGIRFFGKALAGAVVLSLLLFGRGFAAEMQHDHGGSMGHEHMNHESTGMHAPAASDRDTATTRMSEKHLFKVSYEGASGSVPVNRIHAWKLRVETADGRPVKDAEVAVDGEMPEHGHGLPTQPEVVKGRGDGVYEAEGMKFSMPGWWVVTVRIKTADAEDRVHFNLVLP